MQKISSSGCVGVDLIHKVCSFGSRHFADHHDIHAAQEEVVVVAVGPEKKTNEYH